MKNLYKQIVAGVSGLLLLTLAGCNANPAGDNFGHAVETWRTQVESQSYVHTNVEEYTKPHFADSLGFAVVSYPDTKDLKPTQFFVIDKWFGQIEYTTADNRTLVVRVAYKDDKSLEYSYQEYHGLDKKVRQVDGIDVTSKGAIEDCYMTLWVRGDFQYLVHSNKDQPKPSDEEIDELVKGLDSQAETDASSTAG